MTDAMSPKQLESIRESKGRVNIWSGSVRSGKTIASLYRWLMYVANTKAAGELIVVARTRDSAYRNVFQPLMDPRLFGEFAKQVSYTSGAPTATMFGRVVHVIGASDAKAEKILRGLTCGGAYVDEITVIPYEFFAQLLYRLWDKAKLFGTTNPDSPAHWFKVNYLDRLGSLANWRHWQFYLDDNPALTPENKAAIIAENVGLFYRRYVLGEWVLAEGSIYSMWDPTRHVLEPADLPTMDRVLALGIDYGTTNATRGILVGIARDLERDDPRPRLYALNEWAPGQLTDAELSGSLRYWMASQQPSSWQSPEWVAVDPAAASFKLQLFADGMQQVTNARNAVLPGIRTVASLLATGSLQISSDCTELIREIPGYVWDTKATLKGEDKPIKVADHSCDALRYAAFTTRSLWRDEIPMTTAVTDTTDESELPTAA